MKHLWIIGAGMGAGTLTADGQQATEDAQALFGSPRLTAALSGAGQRTFPLYDAEKVCACMEQEQIDKAALLVSGDTGFYSAAAGAARGLPDTEVTLVPGISSVSYFFARLGKSWQDAKLVSCHGRSANLVDAVRRNALAFALTGGNCAELAVSLCRCGFGALTVHVGENLGAAEEVVSTTTVETLAKRQTASLTVLLIENPAADARVQSGIPDDAFLRSDVPMTKAEVRAVTMSQLGVKPTDVCWDIGCGTGSVTVEMALAAYEGHVWAVDRAADAVVLTDENCRRFQVGNVTAACGSAPAALADLPPADRVFIGGSGGEMASLFDLVWAKNPKARIAVNAIALESAAAALAAFRSFGVEPELVQFSVARGRAAGGLHLMMGQNPIYLLCGGRADE